jgi:hypothetical protein
VQWGSIIIAYYPNIYCAEQISEQKLAHEQVHLERQRKIGVDNWYGLYLDNDSFRLEEEIMAYKKEIEYIKSQNYNRQYRRFLLDKIYSDLSSYIYDLKINKDEAKRLLD